MTEESRFDTSVVLSLAETLGRRRFMGMAVRAAGGLAAAIVGVSQAVREAGAVSGLVNTLGCSLCNNSTSCTGTCCWSWSGCTSTGHVSTCKECYTTRTCGPTCPSKCSQATVHNSLLCEGNSARALGRGRRGRPLLERAAGQGGASDACGSGTLAESRLAAGALERDLATWLRRRDGPYALHAGWAAVPGGLLRAAEPAWLAGLLVLALGRRRRRHLGPDQPARAAVDPPRRDPVETLGRQGHHH